MAYPYSENFDATTVGTLPSGFTGDTGNWSVQTATAGLTTRSLQGTISTVTDKVIEYAHTRQTTGVHLYKFKVKTGSSFTSNHRSLTFRMKDGTSTVLCGIMFYGSSVDLDDGSGSYGVARIISGGLTVSTVYTVGLYLDIPNKKFWVVIDGTTYDNSGSKYNANASTTGLDRPSWNTFSGVTTGGTVQEIDDVDLHLFTSTKTYTADAVVHVEPPGAGTLGAGTVDRFGEVTATFTEGTGTTTSLKVYRSNDGTNFADVTTGCTTTDNGSTWTITDRRPHSGSESVTYGGTAYYKVVGVNSGADSADSNTVTVASVDIDLSSIVTSRAGVLSTIMAGTSVPSSGAGETYPGYWVLAMAYAYLQTATAQYKTDCLAQFNYIVASCTTADGLILLPADTSFIFRDYHSRTIAHVAVAARLLARAGATTDAQTLIDQCDVWAKAFFDNLNSGNPAPTKTFAGWDANNTTGTGNQQVWQASTAYTAGAIVRPTSTNSRTYRCTTAGTSSGTQPTWPTTAGGTVTDGTVTWTETTKTVQCTYQTYSTVAGHAGTGGTQLGDVNQNAQEALAFALLLTDTTSDFYPAGTYHTKALTHVTDQTHLVLTHATSTGAVPIGEAFNNTQARGYDTLYGGYTLQVMSLVQTLMPTLNTYLSGFISRALSFMFTNYYGTEPPSRVRYNVAEPGVSSSVPFYDYGFLNAAASVTSYTNPQAKLIWTAAFQRTSADKVGNPYSATGQPGTLADAIQAEMFEGPAYVAAGLVPATVTYTGDAIVKVTSTKTYTADARVSAPNSTKTYTADAVIVSLTQTATYTADAVISAPSVVATPVDVTLSVVAATDVDLSVSEATTVTLTIFPA